MHHAIRLPGRTLTPAAYLAALRLAAAAPAARFRESFRDPTGWTGPHTGAEILAEHWAMVREKWAAQIPTPGKGNRARKRAERIADAKQECRWCGQLTGSVHREFCDAGCRRSYGS